jgi:hypothetical protein
MRKIVLSLAALLILTITAVYVFIPSQIIIKGKQIVYNPSASVIRGMMQTEKWSEWMPKEVEIKVLGSLVATIQASLMMDGVQVPVEFSIENGENKNSIIGFVTSMDIRQWSPIARVQYYIYAKRIQSKLDHVLEAAKNHYNYSKGIYGFEIVETKVKDSSLITIDQTSMDTPSIAQIYQMVNQLEQYILSQNGKAKGAPMVNITRLDEKEIYTQVAIPIERDIAANGDFVIKKMVLGNLLSVEVQGDQKRVNDAFEATKQYINDKQKSSPAIPFIIYNTNRLLEKDATKWKSTINYPIF